VRSTPAPDRRVGLRANASSKADPAGREPWAGAQISDRDFRRLAKYVEERTGIQLNNSKKVMVETRLRRRLRDLSLTSFADYCDLALANGGEGEEATRLIDQMTTNKTDFFREPGHFEYLVKEALPTLARERGSGHDRPFRVWSAACSTGEEPYTLAMILSDVAAQRPGFRFEIHASDISTEVLAHARRAIYEAERIEPVPRRLRATHLLQSKDRSRGLVRIAPATREMVQFRRQNLVDSAYPFREPLDAIFCRNVFIYFDRATQEQILNRFCRVLAPGGYVFLGHSEAINGHDVPLKAVAPTTYRAQQDK
jgi:chemotaxis protein methyltransferase CheR